ncbi:MAG: hypothetical protein ACYDA2_04230 [Acidimicrobiales bacterium]
MGAFLVTTACDLYRLRRDKRSRARTQAIEAVRDILRVQSWASEQFGGIIADELKHGRC